MVDVWKFFIKMLKYFSYISSYLYGSSQDNQEDQVLDSFFF